MLDKLHSCIADWCNLFATTYHAFGMPLELQQLSISDPTNSSCTGGTCGPPPNGVSGDLRLWLPFAVSNDATVFEIYYQDLGLAFDSSYCTSSTMCYFPASGVTTSTEWTWYNDVGRGNSSCPPGTTDTTDCYSAVIDAAHRPH